jgi:secretory phospholipase A2
VGDYGDDPAASPDAEAPTAFGKEQGKVTAKKILPLPCNQHDLCYQTCGARKTDCDNAFFDAMFDVCLKAFSLPSDDRDTCFYWAEVYKDGVAIWGEDAYDERQEQYCTAVDIQN